MYCIFPLIQTNKEKVQQMPSTQILLISFMHCIFSLLDQVSTLSTSTNKFPRKLLLHINNCKPSTGSRFIMLLFCQQSSMHHQQQTLHCLHQLLLTTWMQGKRGKKKARDRTQRFLRDVYCLYFLNEQLSYTQELYTTA
ncbi:hypothetical protein PRUPE_5G094500 [Prunus persica]|uniref:Uncharacterized protein n=1 Tax=Prunus persica TaxID=3760 RepID=A0A251P609_PRUPE|nr:hypothetical protein PRUPE_5G094500 [Prunus persica]